MFAVSPLLYTFVTSHAVRLTERGITIKKTIVMKHRLIALGLLASAVGLAQAQSTRQWYLVKGKKVVATFPASDVDFITFDGTQQFYLPITLK